MIRKAFIIQVKEGRADEYHRLHNPIPEALETELKQHGISNYSIFLHPATRYLFCYMEIADIETFNALADSLICQRWWVEMTQVLEVDSPSSKKAWEEPLQDVFHLP